MNFNPALRFFEHAVHSGGWLVLHVDETDYSFGELASLASATAGWLGPVAKVGIVASRSLAAYAGVLGSAWCGAAYVPMNPKTPEDRLARIFETVGFDAVIADDAGIEVLTPRLSAMVSGRILTPRPGGSCRISPPVERDASGLAYVIFTSGSTGTPKGVMISAGSLHFLLDTVQARFGFHRDDRFSQASELTFDVSVFDMFSAWNAGASVHVVPANELMAPARFIREQRLTVWSSVPAIPSIMRRMRMLRPGAFPDLRYSLFAGEPLALDLVDAWRDAAPQSAIENLYGPTEATIVCIGARLNKDTAATPGRGTAPIGNPFPATESAILDLDLDPVLPGSPGQLALAGPNLALGYLNDPALTHLRFRRIRGKRWYLTGDLAVQDASGVFHHLGRIDHQVKILGNRVELEEVEAHLRSITNSSEVAAVAWPVHNGSADGIVVFVTGSSLGSESIQQQMRQRVPAYMIPRRTIHLDSLPLNANGKVDRGRLVRYLDEMPAER